MTKEKRKNLKQELETQLIQHSFAVSHKKSM
jgi:hypothetical protein